MPHSLSALFRDEVLNAVVGLGSDAPIPLEIKIVELIGGDDVATADSRHFLEDAIFDDPAFGGKSVLLETAPARSGFAIEQQPPAGRFLAGGQLIQFGICFRRAQAIGQWIKEHQNGAADGEAKLHMIFLASQISEAANANVAIPNRVAMMLKG